MTKAEFYAIAEDACAESLLHASYSLSPHDYETSRLANRVILAGLRERLGITVDRDASARVSV